MIRERRAATRVRVDIAASMYLFHYDMHLTGAVVDLSLGGCFIRLDGELPAGEECTVELSCGEGLETRSIYARGRIIRTNDHGTGIQFVELAAADRDLLAQLIAAANLR